MRVVVKESTQKGKKYMAKMPDKTIHFGAKGYEDFIQRGLRPTASHKDENRKENYLKRHRKNEDWNDPSTAGFWARHMLWTKPTLQKAAKSLHTKGLNVVVK